MNTPESRKRPPASAHLVGPEPTGFGFGGRQLSPFVGRQAELHLLQERQVQIETLGGHAVGIMGEPGVGKSRLLYEFTRLLPTGTRLLQGRCLSTERNVPYHLFRNLLRHLWQLDEGATVQHLQGVVLAQLEGLQLPATALLPYVLACLGAGPQELRLAHLSPEALTRRIREAVRDVVLAHARGARLVTVLEDLHWLDRASEAALATLIEGLPGAPVLVLASARPGYRAPWLDKSWASQLALPPLTVKESEQIVASVLAHSSSAYGVEGLAKRGEGNPFFLEELAWEVTERGRPLESMMPPTITAALVTRMDRLGPEPRSVLMAMSVIGREAGLEMIEEVVETPEDLAVHLDELVRREFLYVSPSTTYVFKHVLTQEVAYDRLGAAAQQRLHARVGQALETLHAGSLDAILERLAYHWSRTMDHDRAVRYLYRWADKATATYALAEAVEAIDAALAHGEQLAIPEADQLQVDGLCRLGTPLVLLGRTGELLDRLLPHQERVERLGDPARSGPFLHWLTVGFDHTGRHDQSEEFGLRAVEQARQSGDHITEGCALVMLSFAGLWSSRFDVGRDRARRAESLLSAPGLGFWRSLAFWLQSNHDLLLGHLDDGISAAETARRIGAEIEDLRLQSYGITTMGWHAMMRGAFDKAVEISREAISLTSEPLGRATVQSYHGEICSAAGAYAEGRQHLEESVAFFRQAHFGQVQAWSLARLSELEVRAGQPERGARLGREALSLATEVRFPYVVGLAQRALGRHELATGRWEEARETLDGALSTFAAIQARYDLARARLDQACCCHALTDDAAAAFHLRLAFSELRAMDSEPRHPDAERLTRHLEISNEA